MSPENRKEKILKLIIFVLITLAIVLGVFAIPWWMWMFVPWWRGCL